MISRILFILSVPILVVFGLPLQARAEGDPVVFALSAREGVPSGEQLEKLAGGPDALVARLLEIRTKDDVPFAAVRAEKLLLQYSNRPDVQRALEEDVNAPKTKGLARVVAMHLDSAPTAEARQSLAKAVLSRAGSERDFIPYAKSLLQSSDSQVSRLAKESLAQ